MKQEHPLSLVRCESYERRSVQREVARLLEFPGGLAGAVMPGERVYVKVNALVPTDPEKGVTTHPEVVRAVVLALREISDEVVIGDSPGWSNTASMLKRLYERTGFADVAAETGASLDFDTSARLVRLAGARTLHSFSICGGAAAADRIVSVSKFKTHMFMNVTGAIKNMFGVVAGMNKFTYHSRFSRPGDFADLLVDVALAVPADLHVIDAVVAMDGNGPRQGGLVRAGVLAAGRDPFALDLLMMSLTGHPPRSNRPLAAAMDRGLCPVAPGGLEVDGDTVSPAAFEGFRLPDRRDAGGRVPGFLMDRAGRMLSPRPVPREDLCDGCGRCVDVCPEKAISRRAGGVTIDRKKCINCYCCHELCEKGAMGLARPLALRLLGVRTG